jgi:hypothetical protein
VNKLTLYNTLDLLEVLQGVISPALYAGMEDAGITEQEIIIEIRDLHLGSRQGLDAAPADPPTWRAVTVEHYGLRVLSRIIGAMSTKGGKSINLAVPLGQNGDMRRIIEAVDKAISNLDLTDQVFAAHRAKEQDDVG